MARRISGGTWPQRGSRPAPASAERDVWTRLRLERLFHCLDASAIEAAIEQKASRAGDDPIVLDRRAEADSSFGVGWGVAMNVWVVLGCCVEINVGGDLYRRGVIKTLRRRRLADTENGVSQSRLYDPWGRSRREATRGGRWEGAEPSVAAGQHAGGSLV